MEKILDGKVEAIVATYTETGGNASKVKTVDGDLLLEKSVKTVLKDICKHYHYDLASSNKKYGQILGIKKMPPIPFTEDLILIAVKTRSPIGKSDGAFSYLNIEEIDKIKDQRVYFKSGSSLEILAEDKTVLKKIKLAKLLKSQIAGKSLLVREVEPLYAIGLEDRLDIKKDLIIIYEKIEAIEKLFLKENIKYPVKK